MKNNTPKTESNDSKSNPKFPSYQIKTGEKIMEITPNRFAHQTNGSAVVRMGDTVVMATAVMSPKANKDLDYFPLSVEYEENYWASGKIKGSRFIKRKGRPTDEAILSGRLIDRSLRPLFPKGMRNDVQIIITVMSFDFLNDARPLGIVAASVALAVSDIPFEGALSGVHIGRVNDNFIINPNLTEQEAGTLSLFVSGIGKNVSMVEAGAKEIDEETMLQAITLAQEENEKITKIIEKMQKDLGKEKTEPEVILPDEELKAGLKEKVLPELEKLFDNYEDKQVYEQGIKILTDKIVEELETEATEEKPVPAAGEVAEIIYEINKELLRSNILEKNKRLGGRKMDQVRPLNIEVGILPRPHGSAVFTRGETQGLTTLTLGSPGDEMLLDGMTDEKETTLRYMHFYSFPPYSVGECGFMRGPGRREIGHGALGEKALVPMLPDKEKFPYTMVMHTEIMASDGSTSMASVCGSTLALMDGGIPLIRPVSGVAMGLIVSPDNKKYQVLTDLCANEDFAGHMDFKVAGTEMGITALQMDIKVKGLTFEILQDSLNQAKSGRMQILKKMLAVIEKPRKEMSSHAPRIETIQIDPEKIGALIGPGGKTVKGIIDKTGVDIDIEDDGTVFVSSPDQESLRKGLKAINLITKEPKPGEVYIGTVTRVLDFGAMIEFLPGKEGLIHISKLSRDRRARTSDIVKIGDKVRIKIDEIDAQGRFNLGPVPKDKKTAEK